MAIPDVQTLMRPILVELQDGQPRAIRDVRGALVAEFALTEDELTEQLPSGRAKTFHNRVAWATTYLYRTGLLARPRRAVYAITDRGQAVLAANPERVDLHVLAQFPELAALRSGRDADPAERQPTTPQGLVAVIDEQAALATTPHELIAAAYRKLRAALIAELLDSITEQDPSFFESLVLDVLQAIGYGGSRDDAADRLGQSGDGGVDGVIREDRLGLDQIYVQAKKWAEPVSRPEIQKFFGALHGKRATRECSSRPQPLLARSRVRQRRYPARDTPRRTRASWPGS